MHIYEGVLGATDPGRQVMLAGAAATAIGTAIGLYRMDYERVPQVAVVSSAFFVASLIHVPLGPNSMHLVLGGLMGLVLGWAAFPAVLIALLLQAVFFSIGGLTTLGLNTLIMALPAVVCCGLFRRAAGSNHETLVFLVGCAAGANGILLGAWLAAGALWTAGQQFEVYGNVFLAVHLPVAGIEGMITGSVVVLLRKVRPELLRAPLLAPGREEALYG